MEKKIKYKGKTIVDFEKIENDIKDLQEDQKDDVSSEQVKRIEIVSDYPAKEENGVLYIKLEK